MMTDISLPAEFTILSPLQVYTSLKKLIGQGSHIKPSFLKVGMEPSVPTAQL